MTTEEQYRQVYDGITAVASRCDGAVTKDNVGFNGQDTKFGRRVASVPFEEWTDDVKQEAARIALTYKAQIESYTGIDVATLDVVRQAQDWGTNYTGRQDARNYERRAAKAGLVDKRLVDFRGGIFVFSWEKGDPDFGPLLDGVKALPGRRFNWDRKVNEVPRSTALEDFIQTWDFPLTEAARAALSQPFAAPEVFNISLNEDGTRVIIDTPYDPRIVEATRHLPGRRYIGGSINHADIDPMIVSFAQQFGLKVHPDALAACTLAQDAKKEAQKAAAARGERGAVMSVVSRCGKPEELPEAFLDLLRKVLD